MATGEERGKRFFNEEWRDMLLAFIQGLKDENGEIKMKVTEKRGIFANGRMAQKCFGVR